MTSGEQMSKRLAITLYAALAATAAGSSETDGPFGYVMGSPVSAYEGCKPTSQTGEYECGSPPRPHPDAVAYFVKAYPEAGICSVRAITQAMNTDPGGEAIRSRMEDLGSQITERYGSFRRTDEIRPSSTWKEPNSWVMSILKGDRTFYFIWDSGSKASLKNGIRSITLGPTISHSDKDPIFADLAFEIFVNVEFENYERCKEQDRQTKAKAF
jgi:hypothetical protein